MCREVRFGRIGNICSSHLPGRLCSCRMSLTGRVRICPLALGLVWDLGELVSADQGRWARAPGGRHWVVIGHWRAASDGSGTAQLRHTHLTAACTPRCALSEPQPATASHDGGSADRPHTRMPRRTPAGLSHAAMPSTRVSRAGGSVAVRP